MLWIMAVASCCCSSSSSSSSHGGSGGVVVVKDYRHIVERRFVRPGGEESYAGGTVSS
jgi:hypothetical protein